MKLKRAEQIRAIYDVIEAGEPDISTERLLWQTSERCNCDVSDVCEALQLTEATS